MVRVSPSHPYNAGRAGCVCIIIGVSGAIARFPSKSQKISKKSLMSLIVISYNLKPVKISYANGRVSVRIFYKNNSSSKTNNIIKDI